jgi:hypothetical protein
VCAPNHDNTKGNFAGSVFVFAKSTLSSSSSWTQMTQLLSEDGAWFDSFGESVPVSKNASTIVVGAGGVDFGTDIPDTGAA